MNYPPEFAEYEKAKNKAAKKFEALDKAIRDRVVEAAVLYVRAQGDTVKEYIPYCWSKKQAPVDHFGVNFGEVPRVRVQLGHNCYADPDDCEFSINASDLYGGWDGWKQDKEDKIKALEDAKVEAERKRAERKEWSDLTEYQRLREKFENRG